MTANQIMIPVAGFILLAGVVYLRIRTQRIRSETEQRTHRPNSPETGVDKAEIARSAMAGMMGRDR